jgi:hypothetical protein
LAKFTDKHGESWTVHISLEKTRRLATVVGVDVFNPSDYQKLLESIGVRLEYIWHCCRERADELEVASLDAFAERLMNENSVTDASDALQVALINFYRRMGQTALLVLAETNLTAMQDARKEIEDPNFRKRLDRQLSRGARYSRSRLDSELTGDLSPSES